MTKQKHEEHVGGAARLQATAVLRVDPDVVPREEMHRIMREEMHGTHGRSPICMSSSEDCAKGIHQAGIADERVSLSQARSIVEGTPAQGLAARARKWALVRRLRRGDA